MIVYKNKDNTVRIIKSFRARTGKDIYSLEHFCSGFKIFGITIIKNWWNNGSNPHAGVPPISTSNIEILNSWIEHYNLEKIEDV